MSENANDKFDVKEFVKNNEASRGPELVVYLDSLGIPTVGYGHKITTSSPPDIRSLKEGDKISAERAESLFQADFKYHADEVSKMPGFDEAPPLAKAAVIDLAFNMGPRFYKNFKKFTKAFAEGDYDEAALELKRGSNPDTVSRYYSQTGKRPERVMALLRGQQPEEDLTGKINSLVRRLKEAGGTVKDLASGLQTDIETAYKLFQLPDLTTDQPDVTLTDLMAQSKPSVSVPNVNVDRPDVTLTDLMAQSKPSVSVPNVNVDRPDVTLTDLMAQSKPSVSVPNIPSAGSPQGYNPYTQGIDLGRQQPPTPVPDPVADVLAPLRKEISPMGTYGMTREEFEAARGPRIGDVKRSDLPRPDIISSDLPDEIQTMVKEVVAKRTPTKEVPEYESSLPPEIRELVVKQINRKNEKAKGFAREFAAGATLETADELEALVNSLEKGTSYSVEKTRINKEREEYTYLNPGASVGAEALGILPGAALSSLAMTKAGITSIPAQSTIDAGTYGFMSGESVEERLIYGAGGAAAGYVTGRVLDSIFKPSLPQKSTNIEALHTQQTNELQQSLSSQKIVMRPDAQLTDDEVVDQLIIRETEFLADALGRQGVDPNKLGNFNIRLLNFGSEMGVSNKQLNKIVSKNKRINQLRKDSTRGFVDADDLNAYRRDLLDNVAGRFALDVNRTIPAAQSTVVKLRRLGSPLATLAETVVGKAFSERIIRGMNRVVRGQSELDQIWKGMEDLRTLADDVAFNDLMLDAVNAQRLGAKAAQGALNRAKAYANKKIGEGAGDRLQRFLDDNVAFNQRYRRDVTKGVLSDIWMHSAIRSMDDDVSLRVNRARAASKAEDDASKARKRRAMAKEREKPLDEQLEYANIFDSHWRWQRETLTRMELGKQIGLRTSGAPLVAPDLKDLPKALRKKVEAGEMTPLEALAKIETDTFKLFDEKIIREALEAEGLSDVQIKNAVEILDDLGVNANRGMAQELEMVRSLGYVGTIANPYGALMNVHDLFNASFELGAGNVLKAVFNRGGIRLSADDVGLGQQVFGDFVRRANKGDPKLGAPFIEKLANASEDLLRWSMKASGFAGLDKFGKGRIMGASFNKAKQDIRAGNFDEKWKHSFSRGELDQLKRDIVANNINSELVRDLVMFDLFRLQPINAAAQTSFGLANPNARLFYMLKGFAIKQFDLMERRIFREWQQGNKKEALNNAMKYLVLSGGGYGLVNEARQVIKGEAPDPEEAAMGALYQIGSVLTFGAMGANDYGYAKFMEDPAHAMLLNTMPPIGATLPAAVLEDVSDAVRKGDPLPDETIYALPIVGKTLKGVFGD